MERVNYHTHCEYCRHARGKAREYVEEAVKKGVVKLGFSDHMPFYDERFGLRMPYAQLGEYIDEVEALREEWKEKGEPDVHFTSTFASNPSLHAPCFETLLMYSFQFKNLGAPSSSHPGQPTLVSKASSLMEMGDEKQRLGCSEKSEHPQSN